MQLSELRDTTAPGATIPLAYSPKDAGKVVGVGENKIRNAMNDGDLPAKKCGKLTLIARDDLLAWFNALPKYERGQWLTPDRSKNKAA